jgi:origin recognition complex subunit 2
MARRKTRATAPAKEEDSRPSRKRSRQDVAEEDVEAAAQETPSKRRRSSARKPKSAFQDPKINGHSYYDFTAESDVEHEEAEEEGEGNEPKQDPGLAATPRKRGRPPKALLNGSTATPSNSQKKKDLVTPIKEGGTSGATPRRLQAWDRSARRKSARALIERVVGDDVSDGEGGNEDLARKIYESSEEEDEEDEEGATERGGRGGGEGATTPSKAPRRKPGRPKKARSPTPPRDLPAHELYFLHNKPGRVKTSNNTLAGLELLTHDEYFSILRTYKDRHEDDIAFLESLHSESFLQWSFELSQGFSICLFGFGSKRQLLLKFASHVHSRAANHKTKKIVIINGYVRTLTVREIMTTVLGAVDASQRLPASQPAAMIHAVSSALLESGKSLTLIINSIDSPPLRKPGVQSILGQLASLPQIQLISSADTPDFPLLWDSGLRSSFNFVFHDCTTFAPFTVEVDIVDDVHELLGRKARRVNGREGVAFVLKSLTKNARDLYELLVGEVLEAMPDDGVVTGENPGVEYRIVYNKAVERFICTSEMNFRGLLKE